MTTELVAETSPFRPFIFLVGSDLEAESGYAFDLAIGMALRIPYSQVHVVHVAENASGEADIKRLAGLVELYAREKSTADSYSSQSVGVHVRQGQVSRELARVASDVSADLLLLGAPRRTHLGDLVHGSLAARLQRMVRGPVLVAMARPEVLAAGEPVVEPPCPACVRARSRSTPRQWWCERHNVPPLRAHQYSYQSELPFRSRDASVELVDRAD